MSHGQVLHRYRLKYERVREDRRHIRRVTRADRLYDGLATACRVLLRASGAVGNKVARMVALAYNVIRKQMHDRA